MAIKILFFAQAMQWVGQQKLEREINQPLQIAELIEWQELSGLKEHLAATRFAVNQEFVDLKSWVKDGDEIAVLPPMSGG